MADQERDEPSLEMPRLRLRRPRGKRRAAPEPVPAGGEQETEVLPQVEETAAAAPPPAPEPIPAPVERSSATVVEERPTETTVQLVAVPPPPAPEPEPDPEPEPRRRRPITLPQVAAWPAVVVTGLVVGLVVVGLTWASLRTCESIQGTATCGTAGYPMLALVLVVAVLVGSLLLRLTQVPDPVSTSILGIGVASVLALVFLIDHLDQAAMLVVIPVLCAATFAGAHWLTTAVVEPSDR
ncbi:hypothetical protein ASC77_25615 [Nocardioides sp. Root1257]|uniref:hypothetical protein n=1 Tax=unclassified Nocardioides TaxID=2615069 RepID=UPI0006FB3951|nr:MULTISPECIES: hypothetical protein [unclassified Nocardioides]KQW50705.1 hypothetical protein ASC77_25615 [Nocardioides sp. Root1257]KRC51531.1 hypothetical protein ASE24_25845 [Nocardioides sp. Root224]